MLLTALTGCALFERKGTTDMQSTDASADLYSPTGSDGYASTSGTGGGVYDAYGSPAAGGSTYPALAATDSAYPTTFDTPRFHTVTKNDTLYGIARRYYNDEKRWRDVWDANRSTLTDPNKIYVGQRLAVP